MFPNPELQSPLSDDEIEKLDGILSSRATGLTSVSRLDGFFAAIACTPELIMPNEYIHMLLEGETEEDDLSFDNEAEVQEFFSLVFRLQNDVRNALDTTGEMDEEGIPYLYFPIFEEERANVAEGQAWAQGFISGTELRPQTWEKLHPSNFDGEINPMTSIIALAYHDVKLPEEQESFSLTEQELFEHTIMLGFSAAEIYDQFRPERGTSMFGTMIKAALQAGEALQPRVGRNDPCPCGSGKKFKKCCLH